ncbi:MAG: sigma-70 family RNA polymerase sigma factor [Verrucomicrobiaceae bacterium]|nr:sigma-70 family RNA polymerase sigma factor [Verrucomicrobiaceae bacterium]
MTSTFPNTRWSLILAAGAEEAGRDAALAELCRLYWYPLYAHARRSGRSPEDAQDLTQGFFEHVIEARLFERVEGPDKGRLRSFLMRGLQNFMLKEHRDASRLKRGGGAKLVELDALAAEERLAQEPVTEESPERLFDRRWAQAVIEAAHARLRADYERAGKTQLFAVLAPLVDKTDRAIPMTGVAAELGVTEGNARVMLFRLRKQFRAALQTEMMRTLTDDGDLKQEMEHLRAALAAG